jgi:hypothetical protein
MKITNRDFTIEDDEIIITEQINEKFNKNDISSSLLDIVRQKRRLKYRNNRLIEEYNKLIAEENELNNIMAELGIDKLDETDELDDVLEKI